MAARNEAADSLKSAVSTKGPHLPRDFPTSLQGKLWAPATSFPVYTTASASASASTIASSTIASSTITSSTSLSSPDVLRILRKVVTPHIFSEPAKGHFAHSSLSRAIAQVPHLRAGIHAFTEGMWNCASHMVTALEKFPDSGNPAKTAWNLATGRRVDVLGGACGYVGGDGEVCRGDGFAEGE
ncbi:hypothetical protein B0T14DRAFT_490072 [Immersiella caudata]|uniref:Uncharacterized protein n=1 Tax=Immersiella caudata TaxID=314043 RepID=A0AA39XCS1_9PEZI|nr:hypothetical protein B0T14DRAFT_490072 [Immersiella caudata]